VKRASVALLALFAFACASPPPKPLWEQASPPAVDAPIVQPGALHRFELDNGLTLILMEDHRLPRVSIGVSTRRGAASETPEQAGLASYTAELMKRGAGNLEALAFAEHVDALGASFAVSAGFDSMTARVAGLSGDLDALLEIIADLVLRPRFDAPEAERARQEKLAAMERAKDDPNFLERRQALATLYPGLRAGLPLTGLPETVGGMDGAAARAFHERVFIPNGAVLFASGDVDAARLLEQVGAAFGSWTAGEVIDAGAPLPEPAPIARKVVIVDRPDLLQARITLVHDGIARTDPDRIPGSLMNSVLGGSGFLSRLMKGLRSDSGLTYGVRSGFSMRRGGGYFSVSTFTVVSEVRRVVDLILGELERVRAEPPSPRELRQAQALAVGGFALALETSESVLASLVNLDIYGLPEDAVDTYRGRVRATTPDDTARLALERIHPERAAIILVGPAEQLRPQLEGLGPIEVVQP
jgi:predicted Zn-dependent peptidase